MILLTGGSGLLGTELQKHMEFYAPSRQEFDITNRLFPMVRFIEIPKLIVHAGAYTDVAKAESEKERCYQTNVIGTRNLASLGIPMLYISTEYVFDGEKGNYSEEDYPNPRNFYALTKLLGEYECRRTKSVVIRCLFKPRPFEHQAACIDQFTSGDYVDIIGREICFAINGFDVLPQLLHIGGNRKSTYNLARQTKDVIPITIESIGAVRLPRDTSLNCSKWEKLKCKLTSP